jgi:site-specific recombinase
VAGERSADDIQRDIETSRAALAEAVDQLAHRTNPKRLADRARASLRARATSTQGRIVIAVTGGFVVLLVIRRVAKH